MRTPTQDEFTYLPISRQRKYQLRMQREKRCTECGAPAALGSRCLRHLVRARERQRKKRGLKGPLPQRAELQPAPCCPPGGAQFHKSAHDKNAHLSGLRAFEHVGRHDRTMFGESQRQLAAATMRVT